MWTREALHELIGAKMRDHVARTNVYRWGGKILSELLKFEFQE